MAPRKPGNCRNLYPRIAPTRLATNCALRKAPSRSTLMGENFNHTARESIMKGFLLASAAALALAGTVSAWAAAPGDGKMGFAGHPMGMGRMGMHGGHHGAMAGALIARYDANNDGSITRAEIDSGLAKDFKAADGDHNGKVSSAEFKAFMETRHAEMMAKMGKPGGAEGEGHEGGMMRHGPMDPVKHLDWNLDGALSIEEMSAPVRLMAMRLDKDGNGTITATDLLKGRGGAMMEDH